MRVVELTRICILITLAFLFVAGPASAMRATNESDDIGSSAILDKYLKATQGHSDDLRGASMEVEINAAVPKLKENGKLRALRKISKVGQITYHMLSFQGDNTVKNQVIARYLNAEEEGQGDSHISITPENYKFKYKGQKQTSNGLQAHVFQLSPRKKRVGLFKGELWLDARTDLPILERGRLVKNPSIFFRQVDFERAFSVRDGYSIPSYMIVTIDSHLIGKVELNINYSKFERSNSVDSGDAAGSDASVLHANLSGEAGDGCF